MQDALRRLPLARAVPVALGGTVVVFSFGSSSIGTLESVGRTLRWAALAVLLALALAWAVQARGRLRSSAFSLLAFAFVGLALVSASWSVDPSLTAQRAVAFAVLFAAVAALAVAANGRPDRIRPLLVAILVAATLVALGGLLVLAIDPGAAVQGTSPGSPARLRGLGGNPNWVSVLAALALPLAAWSALDARGRRGRGLAIAAGLLLVGTILAADSRAALIAGVAGLLLLLGAVTPTLRRRLALAALAVVVVVAGFLLGHVRTPPVASVPVATGKDRLNPDIVLPLDNEIGRVLPGRRDVSGRSPRYASGRWQAWGGAFGQASKRPLLGHGFGTEDKVFVDRYYLFNANLVENSYLGLYLQLGAAGLVLFVALALSTLSAAVGRVRRLEVREARLVWACLGVLVTGLVLAVGQSYLFSPGSIDTLAFWTCAFLAAAGGALPVRARTIEAGAQPERRERARPGPAAAIRRA